MASFKLCIADPSTGKTFQKEIKDNMARPFIGMNIGDNVKGDLIELNGYEFQITGGSDYCGFPMRRGILGVRKKMVIYGGIGFKGEGKGIRRAKTVCGHKIHDRISQINLKAVKEGPKKLAELFGVAADKAEAKEPKPEKKEHKPAAKEEAKPEVKEHKKEAKQEHKAEDKQEKHEKKAEPKKE